MRIRFNPLPVLTLFSVAAFAWLIWLGCWQWGRYHEKLALIATPPPQTTLAPFTPVPDAIQLVFGVADGVSGWRIFEPVRYGERTVFVDTGFIPTPQPPDWRTTPASSELRSARAVSGIIVHPRAAGAFAAKPDIARRIWYWPDLQGMGRAAHLDTVESYYIALPYLDAAGRSQPNPFALAPRQGLPPEQHLGYAITWWGLAAALIGIYLAFHARQGRLTIR